MGEPIVAPSARKHGVTDEDMLHALRHPIRVEGRDDGPVIIHADRARKQYLLGGGDR